MSMKTQTERIDDLVDRLNFIARRFQLESWDVVGFCFDLEVITHGYNVNQTIDDLTVFGNVYDVTFRHNGDYCWFDPKE